MLREHFIATYQPVVAEMKALYAQTFARGPTTEHERRYGRTGLGSVFVAQCDHMDTSICVACL